MKTFNQYLENKELEVLIHNAAYLFVEKNIEPTQFVLDFVSEKTEYKNALLEYIEIQEGILDSVKDLGNRAFQAAKQFGQNVWSGGGIKGGAKQAWDTMSGPAAKYDTAVRVLNDLLKSLENNPETKDMIANKGLPGIPKNLTNYFKSIIVSLENQKSAIPKMTSMPNTQPQMAQTSRIT
jgi:hypothetical protein